MEFCKTARDKNKFYLLIALVILFSAVLGLFVANFRHNNLLSTSAEKEADKILLTINFDEFHPVATVLENLSSSEIIHSIVSGKLGEKRSTDVMMMLKMSLNASIAYVMNAKGSVIASSLFGYKNKESLLGQNYAFRYYFSQAFISEDVIFYPALGVSTGKRGVYISKKIMVDKKPVGVMVFKIGIDKIDRGLRETNNPSALVDPFGVVFASNKSDWVFKTINPVGEKIKKEIISSKRYSNQKLDNLEIKFLQKGRILYEDKKYFTYRVPSGIPRWDIVVFYPDVAASPFVQIGYIILMLSAFLPIGVVIILINKVRVDQRTIIEVERRLKTIIEKSSDGFLILDGDRVVDCNEASLKMLKLERREDLLNTRPWEISPPEQLNGEDSKIHAALMIDIAIKKGVHRFEWLHRRADGTVFPTEICLTTIVINGKRLLMTLWRDITERKENELLLSSQHERLKQQAAELEENQKILVKAIKASEKARVEANNASKAKSAFLASVSHEVRTPLNGIIGMIDLLLITRLEDEQRVFAETIKSSSALLLNVINDILDFSKIEASRLLLESISFDFARMLEISLSPMKYLAQKKGLEFSYKLDPEIPQTLSGDAGRLRQILTNLIGNSLKFTDQGGIAVHCQLEKMQGDLVGLKFKVRDSGIGIAENKTKSVFEEFIQADVSVTRKYGGTGLGLAISKQLCELMNGEIGVNSEEGKWTEFWFTVELKKGEQKEDHGEKMVVDFNFKEVAGLNILLAEDNKTNQLVAKKLFSQFGVEIQVVVNGEEALVELGKRKYDLIFMDLHMPIMDGIEATRNIRSETGLNKTTPIIAMTASAMEQDRQRCYEAGMNDYLSKPIDLNKVKQILSKWNHLRRSIAS